MAVPDYQNPFTMSDLIQDRPRRCKLDNTNRLFGGVDPCRKSLALDGVVDVLKAYAEYEGGINCSVCGKLYKSRVCFTKHLWEHSIYWDLFDDLAKNQDRVLSIQAALILCGGSQSDKFQDLLVTTPQSHQSKSSSSKITSSDGSHVRKKKTPKRKRYNSSGSDCATSSCSESAASEGVPEFERRYDFDSASSSSDECHNESSWPDLPAPASPTSSGDCQQTSGSIKRRRLSGLPPKKRWMATSLADSRPN